MSGESQPMFWRNMLLLPLRVKGKSNNQHDAGSKLEMTCSSKTSGDFYQSTYHYIPEDKNSSKPLL
jgi:hypothetical protein